MQSSTLLLLDRKMSCCPTMKNVHVEAVLWCHSSKEMSSVLLLPKDSNKVICWRRLDESDTETTRHLIKNLYRFNEPFYQTLKYTEDDISPVVNYAISILKKRQSICAYDQESERVLGVLFSAGPARVRDVEPCRFGMQQTLKQKQVSNIASELYKRLPKEKDDLCVKGEIYFTLPEYSGLGIGTALVEKAVELAKGQNCKYFLSVCTSYYSSRIHEKMGAVCLNQINYADYVDPCTGERMLAGVPLPHTTYKLLCHYL